MLKPEGRARDEGIGAAAVAAWLARSWVVRGAAIGLAMAVVGVALYANALYRQALQSECAHLPPAELSMEELIAVRKRVLAYQVDPAPDSMLELAGVEVGALFGEGESLTLRLAMRDDRAWVDLTLPTEGGCWNLHFLGRMTVDDGSLTLIPDFLQVGDADLTAFVRDRPWQLLAADVPDDRLRKMLRNTRKLQVQGGLLHIQLSNRWDVW